MIQRIVFCNGLDLMRGEGRLLSHEAAAMRCQRGHGRVHVLLVMFGHDARIVIALQEIEKTDASVP